MYTLTKPPSQLASKVVRRGVTQQVDKFSSWELERRAPFGAAEMSSPKPVFNGKRNYSRNNGNSGSSGSATNNSSSNNNNNSMAQEHHPHHEENVRFIADMWNQVQREFENHKRAGQEGGPEYYQDKNPCELKGFEPFNLEEWQATRMVQRLTNSQKN